MIHKVSQQSTSSEYLQRYSDHQGITLVGPLAAELPPIADPVIFVDGGVKHRIGDQGLSVGDGDSTDIDLDVKLDTEKDFSDLAFALSLLDQHFCRVVLCGFLGGRRDHELLNLGELYHFLHRRQLPCRINLDQSVDGLSQGEWQLEVNGTFSLVCLVSAKVHLRGDCKYPIPRNTSLKPYSSLGLSNQGDGTIFITTSEPVFVFHNQ